MSTTITYQFHTTKQTGPVILFGTNKHRDQMGKPDNSKNIELLAFLEESCKDLDYRLVTYEVADWSAQFSPWPDWRLPDEVTGKGRETVAFLKDELIPGVHNRYGDCKIYLLGYSMAGLFSLWAAYQLENIAGVASCSGSLWYPDFVKYVQEHELADDMNIYISLGGKESKTKDLFMQIVDEATNDVVKHLKEHHNVKYEMNPGGHFSNIDKRIAKAVRWIAMTEKPESKEE